jgi:energy-converting hydrogenase Eha subunit B
MLEYTKRFADFERLPTHKAINSDLMFLFGITMQDFLAALAVFLGVCLLPGFLAPFIAIFCAFLVVLLSKKMRTAFPKNHFRHLLWAFGITHSKPIENIFRRAKRRFVSLNR